MNHLLKRALQGAVIAGGLWLVGTGIASAATAPTSPGLGGVVNQLTSSLTGGTLLNAPVNVPVTVCGNSVGVLGSTGSGCPASTGSSASTGSGAVSAPISLPVSVTGNSVSVGGSSVGANPAPATGTTATTTTGASGTVGTGSASTSALLGDPGTGLLGTGLLGSTSGTGGTGGTAVTAPISIPITACGNAVGLLGGASGGCPATTTGGMTQPVSVLGIDLPISVPVTVCGNGVGVLGGTAATCGTTPTTPVPPVNPPVPPVNPPVNPDPTPTPKNGEIALLSAGSTPLAYTGANVLGVLGVAFGLLLAGMGALVTSARRRGSAKV